jgi:hypothetical protein
MGSDTNDNNNDWCGPTSDIVNKVYPDVRVRNEGTIALFTPITPRAKRLDPRERPARRAMVRQRARRRETSQDNTAAEQRC